MKKIVFIGRRFTSIKFLLDNKNYNIVEIITTPNSLLEIELRKRKIQPKIFFNDQKQALIKYLKTLDFDILISNGNPFILPISEMKKDHQYYINLHPSLLPKLKGLHPVNGAFLFKEKEFGVTVHHMNDGIDTGDIIHQKKIELTPDLNIGLVYYLSFFLEETALSEALEILEKNGYHFGKRQISEGSYFSRSDEDFTLDLSRMLSDEIINRVNAFGVNTQGCNLSIDGKSYKVYKANKIINPFVCKLGEEYHAGNIIVLYPSGMIVKCADGIINITDYKEVNTF